MSPSAPPPASRGRYPEGGGGPWRNPPAALVMGGDEQAARFAVEALARAGCRAELAVEVDAAVGTDFILLQEEDGALDAVLRLRERGFRLPILLAGVGPADPEAWFGPDTGIVERLRTPYTLGSLREAITRMGIPLSRRDRSL